MLHPEGGKKKKSLIGGTKRKKKTPRGGEDYFGAKREPHAPLMLSKRRPPGKKKDPFFRKKKGGSSRLVGSPNATKFNLLSILTPRGGGKKKSRTREKVSWEKKKEPEGNWIWGGKWALPI